MQSLHTSDYRGYAWPGTQEEDDDAYPLYVFLKFFLTTHARDTLMIVSVSLALWS